MSRLGSIEFEWGGEDRSFRLALKGLIAIEELSGVSPYAVLERLQARRPMMKDCRTILLHGLVGDGMDMATATKLVKVYCDDVPPSDNIVPATAVLSAALYGVPDDPPGKSEGETESPAPPQEG